MDSFRGGFSKNSYLGMDVFSTLLDIIFSGPHAIANNFLSAAWVIFSNADTNLLQNFFEKIIFLISPFSE